MPRQKKTIEVAERRAKVAELHLKGYTNLEIAKELGVTGKTVGEDMKYIKRLMDARVVKSLEYRKKRHLEKINLVQKKAWDIFDDTRIKNQSIRLAAQRVIISALELGAKVDGLIQEKLTIGPEQASQKLLKELKDLEEKAQADENEGDGHKEEELTSAELGS